MQISARKQFNGVITQFTLGPVNAELTLALSGGHRLVAVLPRGSVAVCRPWGWPWAWRL